MSFFYQNTKIEFDPHMDYMGVGAIVYKMFLTYLKEEC